MQAFAVFSSDRCEKQEMKLGMRRTLRLFEILNETDERKLPDWLMNVCRLIQIYPFIF